MDTLERLLEAALDNPGDDDRYFVLSDWLEEYDDPRKAELLRLHRRLLLPNPLPERALLQARVGELLNEGVELDPRCWQAGFHVTNQYLWVPQLISLPVNIRFDVTCRNAEDEVLPCFSRTRGEWGRPDCDALCWYLSPKHDVFTFRTNLFGGFPASVRHGPARKAVLGMKYRLDCEIHPTAAAYSINEEPYATAVYDLGTVPETGWFGFAVYHQQDIVVEDIRIKSLSSTSEPAP
jgi:uncharacterized protein (TIGR02996 family)